MNERPATSRRSMNAGRSFSSRDWLSTEPWEPRIPDGQTVPLGGHWERAEHRRDLRRSADPVHHAAVSRPTVSELLWVLLLVSLVPLLWWLGWLATT